jgi:hypothetical protein
VNGKFNTYKITTADGRYTLSWKIGGIYDQFEKGHLIGKTNAATDWTVTVTDAMFPGALRSVHQSLLPEILPFLIMLRKSQVRHHGKTRNVY